ncbi:MAG: hypothetical protein IKU43_06035 [Clostridia bacterium]|nr:hypothetical protein [Clostridia bacterium]
MKKLLSVLLSIWIASSCFAFTSMAEDVAVLNADPYVYVDEIDGQPVVYYSSSGTYTGDASAVKDSSKAYKDFPTAVARLDALGGGTVVMMNDIWLSSFPVHDNTIKLRGLPDKRSTITFSGQMAVGSVWFQEHLMLVSSGNASDRGPMFEGKPAYFGMPGGDDDDILWGEGIAPVGGFDKGEYESVTMTFYSGTGPTKIRLLGAFGGTSTTGDATFNFYGGDYTNTAIVPEHSNGWGARVNRVGGDYIFNIYGGKFKNVDFGNTTSPNQLYVSGNMYLNLYGGEFEGTITPYSGTFKLDGSTSKLIVDVTNNPELLSQLDTSKVNGIIVNKVEYSGDNVLEALESVKAGTTSSVEYSGTVKAVGDGITVSYDTTESAHGIKVKYSGTRFVLAKGVTYTLSGDADFDDITIVAEEGATIDAGNYKLNISDSVKLVGKLDVKGDNVSIAENEDNHTVSADDLAGMKNNKGVVIPMENFEIFKADNEITVSPSKPSKYENGALFYYVTSKETAKTVSALENALLRAEGAEVGIEFGEFSVNKWDALPFDMSDLENAEAITFKAPTLPDGYNFYIGCIIYSPTASGYMKDFGPVKMDSYGEVIYPLDDILISGIDWYSRGVVSGITADEESFALGETTMLAPKSSTTDASIKLRLPTTVKPEWQPYIKVEYYFHDNDNKVTDETRMLIKCGDNTAIEAESSVMANASGGIATFEIPESFTPFNEITLYPYGLDASSFGINNKVYMLDTLISAEKNTTATDYKVPPLGADGIILPYSYIPGDGLPVVYVDANGTYKGDYKGSVNSTVAYATIDEAFMALDGMDGYIILCSDVSYIKNVTEMVSGGKYILSTDVGSFPEHTNNITIRGRDDAETKEDRVILSLGGYVLTNGNIAFENMNICLYNFSDYVLAPKGNKLTLGSKNPLFEYDVEFLTSTEEKYKYYYKTAHLEGSLSPVVPKTVAADLVLNSCNLDNLFLSNWAQTWEYDKLSYVLNGNKVNGIVPGWVGQGKAIVNGDANITVTGGKLVSTFTPFGVAANNIGGVTVNGDFTFAVTGGDFSAIGNNAITLDNSLVTITGNKILDLSGYTGDTNALLAKINTSTFDILNINKIYVSDDGNDANDGKSQQTAVKTLEKAAELTMYEKDGVLYCGTVYVSGSGLTIDEDTVIPAHTLALTVSSVGSSALKIGDGSIKLSGETLFENLNIEVQSAENANIIARGNKVVFGKNVSVTPFEGNYVNIYGAHPEGNSDKAEVVIQSGSIGNIYTGFNVEADVDITVNGGKIYGDIVAGPTGDGGFVGGEVRININGGKILGKIIGGAKTSGTVIKSFVTINVNGGEFGNGSEIYAGSTASNAIVNGNSEIYIYGGDFEKMKDKSIKAGLGIYDKSCIDYMNYSGNVNTVEKKVADGFSVVVEPKKAPPVFTSADKIIHILAHYGDPTKALVGSSGVKPSVNINAQKERPVTVSPKQLNLPMNGMDHAFITVGKLKGNKTEVIKLTPNKAPKVGYGVVLDGYNIQGRGVDLTKYKYAEVIYYYNVPEGQTMIATDMKLNPLGSYGAMGMISSNVLEANKWSSALFELGDKAAELNLSGELTQYHLYPYGGKKGNDLTEEQEMYILSLTFYSDKPNTRIPEAKAPSMAKETAEDVAAPEQNKNEIVIGVDIAKLNTPIDNNGSFTAEMNSDNKLVITPTEAEAKLAIEGYSVIESTDNSKGGIINTDTFRYVKLRYYYGSNGTSACGAPLLGVYRSGITGDAAAVAPQTFEAATKKDKINVNRYNELIFEIAPEDASKNKTMHIRLYPFGDVNAKDIPAGDYVIIESLEFCNYKPYVSNATNANGALSESDFVYGDPVSVKLDSVRNAYEKPEAFGAKLTVLDGKSVLEITPNSSDFAVMLDGSDAVKENDGIISFKNYRYLAIKYYYEGDDSAEIVPELTMKSLRGLRSIGKAIGEVTFKAEEKLTAGSWNTVYIPLNGTQSAYLSRGFVLCPFGSVASKSFKNGEKLYVESITFVHDMEG